MGMRMMAATSVLMMVPGMAVAAPTEDQMMAAAVEWTATNCGIDVVHPMYIAMAGMVIEGQHGDGMDAARETVRAQIDATFATPIEACPDLINTFSQGPALDGQ